MEDLDLARKVDTNIDVIRDRAIGMVLSEQELLEGRWEARLIDVFHQCIQLLGIF